MEPGEVRVFRVTQAQLRTEDLRFRDLIDMSETSGVDVMKLSDVLSGKGSGADRLRALAAFVWIIFRHEDKSLTYEDVLNGRVEVEDGVADAPLGEKVATNS